MYNNIYYNLNYTRIQRVIFDMATAKTISLVYWISVFVTVCTVFLAIGITLLHVDAYLKRRISRTRRTRDALTQRIDSGENAQLNNFDSLDNFKTDFENNGFGDYYRSRRTSLPENIRINGDAPMFMRDTGDQFLRTSLREIIASNEINEMIESMYRAKKQVLKLLNTGNSRVIRKFLKREDTSDIIHSINNKELREK